MASAQGHLPGASQASMSKKDYDYYIAKYGGKKSQTPVTAHTPTVRSQQARGVNPMAPVMEQLPMRTPPRAPTSSAISRSSEEDDDRVESDDALLDLAQLEELHHEAERMKALGNKHMAAQVRCPRATFCD
jgi:hypothetical protein